MPPQALLFLNLAQKTQLGVTLKTIKTPPLILERFKYVDY